MFKETKGIGIGHSDEEVPIKKQHFANYNQTST